MLMILSKNCFLLNIYDEPSKSSRHSWLVGKITLFPVIMICPRLWLRINDNQIRICFEFGRVLPISVFLLLSTTSLYQGYTVHNNLSCSIPYSSMTSLLMHTVAHFTRPSYRPKNNNQPLAVSWVNVVKNGKNLTFKVTFLCQKLSKSIIQIFLIFFSLKNMILGAHFLLLTFFENFNF